MSKDKSCVYCREIELDNVTDPVIQTAQDIIFEKPVENTMDNKIKELMIQSELWTPDYINEHWDKNKRGDIEAAKKFAELVIQECIVCAQMEIIRNGHNTPHNLAIKAVLNRIQNHFGILNEKIRECSVKSVETCEELYVEKVIDNIVRECIKICESSVGNSDYTTGRMNCAGEIKEHFGIK